MRSDTIFYIKHTKKDLPGYCL